MIGTAAAGATKAQALDGELLAFCTVFAQEHAEQVRREAKDQDTLEAVAAGDAHHEG